MKCLQTALALFAVVFGKTADASFDPDLPSPDSCDPGDDACFDVWMKGNGRRSLATHRHHHDGNRKLRIAPPPPSTNLLLVDRASGLDSYRCGYSNIHVTLPPAGSLASCRSVSLLVSSFDIDRPYEINKVYLNGNYRGILQGANNIWQVTSFSVSNTLVNQNSNNVIRVEITSRGWCARIDWVALKFGNCNAPPEAVCQEVTKESCGVALADAYEFDGGSTDPNGDNLSFSVSPAGPYSPGVTAVTLTASDGNGGFDTCTTIMTVGDTADPSAVCQDLPSVVLDSSGQASIVPSDIDNGSSDECGLAPIKISQDSFNCSDVGSNDVTLVVSDVNGNSATCSANVTATNSAPSVMPLQSMVVFVDGASGSPIDNGDISVTASDPEGQLLSYSWSTTCAGANFDSLTSSSATLSIAAGTEPAICSTAVQVCDVCGACTSEGSKVVIVDPAAGFVTGGGYIESPAGAFVDNATITGNANFGFVSKYEDDASVPSGDTEFVFTNADVEFNSSSLEWLIVSADDCAMFMGAGTLNGVAGFGFTLAACDNGEPGTSDTFRIKIWNDGNVDELAYANVDGGDDSYDATFISGGNIQIHRKKHKNGGKKNNFRA